MSLIIQVIQKYGLYILFAFLILDLAFLLRYSSSFFIGILLTTIYVVLYVFLFSRIRSFLSTVLLLFGVFIIIAFALLINFGMGFDPNPEIGIIATFFNIASVTQITLMIASRVKNHELV